MKYVALDIETIRDESLIDTLPEPDVAVGNLKDPEKIAAKVAEAKAKQISDMALSPLTGKVCSCATSRGFSENIVCCNTDEKEILNEILDGLNMCAHDGIVVVTWNGNGFDLPFIYRRAMLNGIKLPPECPTLDYWTKRYTVRPHADLMQVWSSWESSRYSKLDTVARALLGEAKAEIDVQDFLTMMKTAEGRKAIEDYNLRDARLTGLLYEKMSGYLFR